jgi:DNA primase
MENRDDFRNQVRNASDIVEVISDYVPLKKRGRDYWACCPFHGEKTPSFSVSKEKQFFYCYGCHVGGDVFEFVRRMENCTFPEALKILAQKANIPLPDYQKSEADIKREENRKQLLEVNDLAARFYAACLHKTAFGTRALSYLHQRGITDATIANFSLGAALPGTNSLIHNLSRRQVTPEQLFKAGLVRNRGGNYVDAFFNRVMIPIKDPRGKVVAFGGRSVGDGLPKYLNTADTELFQKGQLLFGLDVALKPIREAKQAIVVEGYMDAISLHAAGVSTAVASLGTAFSGDQAKLLARICETVVFVYDSDEAGKRNAVRAISIARAAGLKVKSLSVPEVKDPDEYIRKFGRDAFLKLVEKALDGTEFQLRYVLSKNNVTNLAGKVQAVSNILPFLVECKSKIEVAAYIRLLAQWLTIDEGLIMEEYNKAVRKSGTGTQAGFQPGSAPAALHQTEAVTALDRAERSFLKLMLGSSALAPEYQAEVEGVGFSSQVRRDLYAQIAAHAGLKEQELTSLLFSTEAEKLKEELAAILAGETVTMEDPEAQKQAAADCLRRMKRSSLEAAYEKHRLLADEFERAGKQEFLRELALSQQIKGEIKKLYGNDNEGK